MGVEELSKDVFAFAFAFPEILLGSVEILGKLTALIFYSRHCHFIGGSSESVSEEIMASCDEFLAWAERIVASSCETLTDEIAVEAEMAAENIETEGEEISVTLTSIGSGLCLGLVC